MKRIESLLLAGLAICSMAVSANAQDSRAETNVEVLTITADDGVVNADAIARSAGTDDAKSEEPTAKKIAVTVESSSSSESKDGKAGEKQYKGRVVIVGPDGERKEYDLSKELPNGVHLLGFGGGGELLKVIEGGSPEDHHQRMKLLLEKVHSKIAVAKDADSPTADEVEKAERLMIGVHCGEADEALRGHLKLGEKGLIVLEVVEESPAADAGLLRNDLLLNVGGADLKTVHDLLTAVSESDAKELTLNLLRNGDATEIKVTPKLMKEKVRVVVSGPGNAEGGTDANVFQFYGNSEDGPAQNIRLQLQDKITGLRWNQIHPGIVIERNAGMAEVERVLRAAAEAAAESHESVAKSHAIAAESYAKAAEAAGAAKKSIVRVRREAAENSKASAEDVDGQIERLQEQLKALSARLTELEAKK